MDKVDLERSIENLSNLLITQITDFWDQDQAPHLYFKPGYLEAQASLTYPGDDWDEIIGPVEKELPFTLDVFVPALFRMIPIREFYCTRHATQKGK